MPQYDPEFAQVRGVASAESSVSGSTAMRSNSLYRTNAEDCLRMARTTQDERDRPFWLALAQSWLQLAEQSARTGSGLAAEQPHSGRQESTRAAG